MRLLLAMRHLPVEKRSGLAEFSHRLCDYLRGRHEATVLSAWRRDRSLLPAYCEAVREDPDRPLRSRVAFELAALRLSRSADVVVTQRLEAMPAGARVVALVGDPARGQEVWGRLAPLRKAALRRRAAQASLCIAPSEALRARFVRWGLSAERVQVAAPGVDTTHFSPDPDGLPPVGKGEPVRVLCVGRFEPSKGQHVLVEAIKGLAARSERHWQLDLVGAASDPSYLAALRRRAGAAPVSFHLDEPDPGPWYRRAHLVVVPSIGDAEFGRVAVEAMASGRPVVHSKSMALTEAAGPVGVPVPPGDVGRLGAALRELAGSAARCEDLGAAGRERALSHYRLDDSLHRYEQLIASVS